MTLKQTDSNDHDFIKLVESLDKELALRDGDDHAFYHQYNGISMIKHALVAYIDNIPVGCGAIKKFDDSTMEIKRMFVLQNFRGKGVARNILSGLEQWANDLGFKKCILETGINQHEALSLYKKSGFIRILNYGQYVNVQNSFCFEKVLMP